MLGGYGLISDGTISGRIAKDVFADMFATGKDAALIVDEKGLKQHLIAGLLRRLICGFANIDKVNEYRGGKDKLAVGQV